jgi:tetraacyldisaccharide 4'-kinase
MNARRPWARPLVPLYALGVRLTQLFAPTPRELARPVISVGSLSAGGAGKTPVVIALAQLLREDGWQPVVLSRGYGRERRGPSPACVDPLRDDAARLYGDEPVVLAQRTGVPVWVDANRYRAGLAAVQSGPADERSGTADRSILLLDDGFQHRRLARTVDIVLVTLEDLDDALLPAGNRREPLRALQRAHAVVVRAEEAAAIEDRLQPHLRPGTPVWQVRRMLQLPRPLLQLAAGLRPIAFCALARPEGFRAMLLDAGVGLLETAAFPDHHRYRETDIAQLCSIARSLGATGFWTTEKDAVKLNVALRTALEQVGPIAVAPLQATFLDSAAVLRTIEAAVAYKQRESPR